MNYFRKTIVASLIVMLVSFAGGLCTHPMTVEAHSAEMTMEEIGTSQDCSSVESATMSHTIDVCAVDCITTLPKITTTKKAVVDSTLQISLITPLVDFRGPSSEGVFESDDTFGVSPPVPDILSSVFKRE